MKLAHRLLIFSLGLITLLIAGIVAIVDGRLRGHITEDRVAELQREAALIADHRLTGASPDRLAESSSRALEGRVTLFDSAGSIVGNAYIGRSTEAAEVGIPGPGMRATALQNAGIAVLTSDPAAVPELYVTVRNAAGVTRVAVETQAIDRIFDVARQEVLTAGFIAAVLAMVFSIGYAIYVSGPVIELRDLARALALRDYSRRPPVGAPGEVGDLAQSLVQLATRLETLEVSRTEFIANVSHELCSPLTIAAGYAATLVKDDPPDEVRKQFARAILANTGRMQRVVDDLLDLSKIESGGWVPRVDTVKLRDVASEMFESLGHAAAVRGTSLICDSTADAAVFHADLTAIRQILANLIDNAIRYTSNGTITIFSVTDSEAVCVGVRDTGEGIPPQHLPRIFERFYRADKGRARQSGGTGLGLAIVKHMAEAHGGRVTAESIQGVGTTVRVYFPLLADSSKPRATSKPAIVRSEVSAPARG